MTLFFRKKLRIDESNLVKIDKITAIFAQFRLPFLFPFKRLPAKHKWRTLQVAYLTYYSQNKLISSPRCFPAQKNQDGGLLLKAGVNYSKPYLHIYSYLLDSEAKVTFLITIADYCPDSFEDFIREPPPPQAMNETDLCAYVRTCYGEKEHVV